MRRRTNGRSLVVIAVAALLISACGGDGDGGSDNGEGSAGTPTSFTVQAGDFTFTPDALTVAANTDVTVTLENDGTIEHDWVVLKAGINITSEADFSEGLVETEVRSIAPGSSGTVTLNLTSGTYQVICAVSGHFTAGMEGSLRVSS